MSRSSTEPLLRPRRGWSRWSALGVVATPLATCVLIGQVPRSATPSAAADTVLAIAPPRSPLPSEAASAGVTRFSFIVYGDTRGRRDGVNEQYEHSLVVESMLRTIATM